MNKWVALGIGGIIVVGGLAWWQTQQSQPKMPIQLPAPTAIPPATMAPTREAAAVTGKDPKNATYFIEGKPVTLVDGEAETPAAPGSATMVTTTIFGEPTKGELTGDTNTDAAVMLVQDQGGSGTFYYEAAALKEANGYMGTNAILLGDRIAPQTTQVANETITVNFAKVPEGEPMTSKASEAVSKYFQVKDKVLVEVDQPQGQM